jgi:hypothetical protein
MTRTIINLLNSAIANEVEEVLSGYADHPYQQAFAMPELRQELIAYVLSRAPGSYVVMDDQEETLSHWQALQSLSIPREIIHNWIHEGIQHILVRHAETIEQHIPEVDDPRLAPSHWFG